MMFMLFQSLFKVFGATNIMLAVFELQNVDVVHSDSLYAKEPHAALRFAQSSAGHTSLMSKKSKCGLPREAPRRGAKCGGDAGS